MVLKGINPLVLIVGVLQLFAAAWAAYNKDWKMFVINVNLGISNIVFSTMAK